MQFRETLSFDDVLLKPAASAVLPNQTDIRTRLTRTIELGIPLMSAAMDTVTEAAMAIAMAQVGGIGVIHKNLSAEAQANEVRKVKKFESGMVVNPVTIHPEQTLADALALMSQHQISGIPVVERNGTLVGILTNRDVRFATDNSMPVSALMTQEKLVTVREGATKEEAKRLLHQRRIEKLLVVDGDYRCIGLITVKDIEKANKFPGASKDEKGRLRTAAATTVGEKGLRRAQLLIDADVDVIVVDTAHGHSKGVLDAVARVKKLSNYTQVMAGNVATREGAQALIDAGADAVKIGIGPGSICTTRMVRRRRRLRHDRLAARRHRRGAGRSDPLPGPLLQVVPRHGLDRRHGARLGRPLLPGGGREQLEAGARGRRGPRALQGSGRQHHPSAGGRPARGDGLHRQRHHPRHADEPRVPAHHGRRPARESRARRRDHARGAELSQRDVTTRLEARGHPERSVGSLLCWERATPVAHLSSAG